MLEVQWFYRPEDVDKKYVRHWKSKDARELLYSLHRDEVVAESVMNSCSVCFVPEGKQIPNCGEYPNFIVTRFYDCYIKKLSKLSATCFYEKFCDTIVEEEQQPDKLGLFVAKIMSQVGLVNNEKKKKSRRKQAFPQRNLYKKPEELVDQNKDGLSGVDEGTADNEESVASTSDSVNSDSYLNDF
ncbi:unnamed protein product [Microthlaspi erraticum]|uniref:BAH domain-containing protein n=1 Tax=Microthlaspi erraticum TaxID=1685480 RepID=A0A6D2KTI8_9BRAS|nr:unnamed protein product [Microthlaspi erraticum]